MNEYKKGWLEITEQYKQERHNRKLRYYAIVRYRNEGLTLQEIADKYGITRERVRQILRDGLLANSPRHKVIQIGQYITFRRIR